MAKVSKAVFHRPAVAGDTLVYTTEIESDQHDGALIHGTSRIGGELHGEVELFFAYLDARTIDGELIGPAELLALLRLYGLYDVGQREDGDPLPLTAEVSVRRSARRERQTAESLFAAAGVHVEPVLAAVWSFAALHVAAADDPRDLTLGRGGLTSS